MAEALEAPRERPTWTLPVTVCAWCAAFPCACPPAREEVCVCGGPALRARGAWEWADVIREHQLCPEHRAWRARAGL